MRTLYFVNGGVDTNWSTTGNWSLAATGVGGESIPTSVDDIWFTDSSQNCKLDVNAFCNTLTSAYSITGFQLDLNGYSLSAVGSISLSGGGSFKGSTLGSTLTRANFTTYNVGINLGTAVIQLQDGGTFSVSGTGSYNGSSGQLRMSSGTINAKYHSDHHVRTLTRRDDALGYLTLARQFHALNINIYGKMDFGNTSVLANSLSVSGVNSSVSGFVFAQPTSVAIRSVDIDPSATVDFGNAVLTVGYSWYGTRLGRTANVNLGGKYIPNINVSQGASVVCFGRDVNDSFSAAFFRMLHGCNVRFFDGTTNPFIFDQVDWYGRNTQTISINTISGTGTAKFNFTSPQKAYYVNVDNIDASYGSTITDYGTTAYPVVHSNTTNWVFVSASGDQVTVPRSVGTQPAYSRGTVTVVDPTHLSLVGSAAWSQRWGEGDKIVIAGQTRYISQRPSQNSLTLQTPTTKTGRGLSYTLQRSYTTFESACTGQARDLVAANEVCKIVAYKDSVFSRVGAGLINRASFYTNYPWITDYLRHTIVTSASADRHLGIPGNGVIIDDPGHVLVYVDGVDYAEFSWLELRNASRGFVPYANYFSAHHNIVHDISSRAFEFILANDCIYVQRYRNFVYNCVCGFTDGESSGTAQKHSIYNNTIYNNTYGFHSWHSSGAPNYKNIAYKNNISLGCLYNYFYGSLSHSFINPPGWNVNSSNNIGSSAEAALSRIPGPPSTASTPEVQFVNPGLYDCHLNVGARASGFGIDLGSPYDIDLRGMTVTGTWNVGAYQYDAPPIPTPPLVIIQTNKLGSYQIPGTPIKQIIGRVSRTYVPQYRKINPAYPNVDPSRFQDYMLFQSGLLSFRLGLQRVLLSYPFLRTYNNVDKNWTFDYVQDQLEQYFNYIRKSSILQKYMLQKLKTKTLCLTSTEQDVILVPFIDLIDYPVLFQDNVNSMQNDLWMFDNNVITKKFWGVSSSAQNQVVNELQRFSFVSRDKTYQNTVPRTYTQTVNRRGQIFNLLPSVYYGKDFQFQSLLNIFRQNYDKVWFKNKAIKNAPKISYDKYQKQFLGGFMKQLLGNQGIQYFDINPMTISNILLYNYTPKNINISNSRYVPISFSYGYLSDQFLYRMFTQKNLLLSAKGSRQPLQRLVNIYGMRNRATGDFSGTGWVNIIDFQRYYTVQTLFNRSLSGGTYIDLQSTIDDQVFDQRANAATAATDTTFDDFGQPYGFGLVIDLVEGANNSLRNLGMLDHGLTAVDFQSRIAPYVLNTASLTGNRIQTWSLYGPTGSSNTFSFTRRFKQIKDLDYIFNPFFNVRQQFYPTKNDHIDGVYIKPCIHDLNTVSDKRVMPNASGIKSNDDKFPIAYTLTGCDSIRHVAKYTDLDIFKKYIQSQIKIVPRRRTQIQISNITQLQNEFGVTSTRTTGTKTFSMSLSGFDVGSSTFRFKRRSDDTIGDSNTSKILNMMIQLKQADSGKIVESTDQIIKLSFNAVQDLYSNSVSQDNVRQYNNIKKQFNFVDFFIYPDPDDKTSYITKEDLLQKQFLLPLTKKGLLCSIYGWSGFDPQAESVFEWTLGMEDLSSGDKISFEFKFNRQV